MDFASDSLFNGRRFRALTAVDIFSRECLGIGVDQGIKGNDAESFIGSLRDECLNVNWFLSLEDAQDKIESWRIDCNEYRPHSSLDYKTPCDFAKSRLIEARKLTV